MIVIVAMGVVLIMGNRVPGNIEQNGSVLRELSCNEKVIVKRAKRLKKGVLVTSGEIWPYIAVIASEVLQSFAFLLTPNCL